MFVMTPRKSDKPGRPPGLIVYVGTLGVALAAGLVMSHAALQFDSVPDPLGFWLTAAMIAIAMGLGLWAGVIWWHRIDEAAREAHKWAWWWGGTVGTALAGILLLTLSLRSHPLAIGDRLAAADLLAGGMVTVILFQMAGYTVAWTAWWLRHR